MQHPHRLAAVVVELHAVFDRGDGDRQHRPHLPRLHDVQGREGGFGDAVAVPVADGGEQVVEHRGVVVAGPGGHERGPVPFDPSDRAAVVGLVCREDQAGCGDRGHQASAGPEGGEPAGGDSRHRHHGHDAVEVARQLAVGVRGDDLWMEPDAAERMPSLSRSTAHRIITRQTMPRSQSVLEAFLAGCGVPESHWAPWRAAWSKAWHRREAERDKAQGPTLAEREAALARPAGRLQRNRAVSMLVEAGFRPVEEYRGFGCLGPAGARSAVRRNACGWSPSSTIHTGASPAGVSPL
ncbi:hypothetical protein [Streptomyces sp. NPDC048644]|uniref:hypothetical protein n=1 Tax=Streptomyces sp. NPDC048644 TaxID=3365582 RepID=UPI0037103E50